MQPGTLGGAELGIGDAQRIVDRAGRPAVGGDRLGVVAVVAEQLLGGVGDAEVEARRVQRGQLGEQHLAHQVVAEAEPAALGGDEQTYLDRRFERVEAGLHRRVGGAHQDAQVDGRPDHRGQCEQLHRRRRQRGQPAAHDVAHRRRDLVRVQRGHLVQPSELGDEQRVAAAATVDLADHVVARHPPADLGEQLTDVVGVEATQVEPRHVRRAGDGGEGGGQCRQRGEVGRAVPDGHDHRGIAEQLDHQTHQVERWCVGPLQVVKDDQSRALPAASSRRGRRPPRRGSPPAPRRRTAWPARPATS